MKRRTFLTASAGLTTLGIAQQVQQSQQSTHLKVGEKVPDFSLPAVDNKTFKLSDQLGKKNIVIAFFPAAFTAG